MSLKTFVNAPLEANLAFPAACDFNLKHNPQQTCYVYAEADGTVREVTYLEFGRAVHRAAHALRPSRNGDHDGVVAIIALSDTLLYQAVNIGLMKAGLVPFPISPRLSAPAVANLLRASDCHRVVATQQTLHALIAAVKGELGSEYALEVDEVPALDAVFPHLAQEKESDAFEPYPESSVEPKSDDMLLYLHSSGSTGFPKAIPHTRASMAGWSRLAIIHDLRQYQPRLRFATHMLPAFHTFGVYAQLITPLLGGAEVALFQPLVKAPTDVPPPPTPDSQLEAARACGCTAMVSVPAFIHQWATSVDALEYLKTLKVLVSARLPVAPSSERGSVLLITSLWAFGGGPLGEVIANQLVDMGIKLRSIYGATEFGAPSRLKPTYEEDWKECGWVELDTDACLAWKDQGDGTQELIIPADRKHWHIPAVKNLPDRPGIGRKDDVIVHATGEKTVPAPIEGLIVTSPMVGAVMMFGYGRDEAGLLVEPAPAHQVDVDDDVQVAAYRNAIWPLVEEANRSAPAYSRIFKELILITRKGKPLPRTEKGTVMRRLALQAYKDEIEKIYEVIESHAQTGEKGVKPPSSWDEASVADWLARHVRDITGREMDRTADLFEQGFDSLNATVLRLRLLGGLKSDANAASACLAIAQNVVYQHPSIHKLATLVSGLVGGDATASKVPNASVTETIVSLAARYSEGLPGYVDALTLPKYVSAKSAKPLEFPIAVLLTGTTGNLGAEILAMLLKDDRVSRIYALERAGSASVRERQRARFADKGFNVGLLGSKKLVSLQGDACAERLGQSEAVFEEMLASVSVIIHVAWRLDFNLGVSAFESSIRGIRALVDFARQTQHRDVLRFLFTSSIASAASWHGDATTRGPVPEELIDDPSVCVQGGGYGQGKYVAERVLAASGLEFSSVRVGQVCGGKPRGAWATTDWFPILVKTSIVLGTLPSDEQDVTWLPMDAVAGTLVDAAFSESILSPSHNIVHPRPIQWSQMIKNVRQSIKTVLLRDVLVVPFGDWFAKLETVASRHDVSAQDVPGVKLLEFFRGMSAGHGLGSFSTSKMEAVSETLRNAEPLAQRDADAWYNFDVFEACPPEPDSDA
ncbi:hypothetical protein EV121DRAFT_295859 [Schizophyllum commune]